MAFKCFFFAYGAYLKGLLSSKCRWDGINFVEALNIMSKQM
jgi:hypothetical protein